MRAAQPGRPLRPGPGPYARSMPAGPELDTRAPAAEGDTSRRPTGPTAVGAWAALVAGATAWGAKLAADRPGMAINAAPFVGRWEPAVASWPGLALAAGLAALVIALGPRPWRLAPWRAVLAGAALISVAWLLALNAVDGPGALGAPLETGYEYLAGVPDVAAAGGAGEYLSTFTDRISGYPTHVRGHPPGLVVLLWGIGEIGLDRSTAALGLVLAGWGAAVASALVALRAVAGEAAARRAAPLLALAPGAVWAGTSFDALFAGVVAVGIAATVVALTVRGRRSHLLAAAGGVAIGGALLFSYSVAPVLAVPAAVALSRRRLAPLAVAAVAATAVLLVAASAGFWWLDGLHATREEYRRGLSSIRPYGYFVVGNLAAVAVAAGPALAGGLARARGLLSGPAVLLAGAGAGLVAADLSGLSKGEVERIWLVFVPWLLTAGALAPTRGDRSARGWMAAQAAVAVGIQVGLRSPW